MSEPLYNKDENVGLSPDEIVFRGERKSEHVTISLFDYTPTSFIKKELKRVHEIEPFIDNRSVTWVNVIGLHDTKIIEELKSMDINPIVLSDVLNTEARPKIQEHERSLFVSIKLLHYDAEEKRVEINNLSIVTTNNAVFTFEEQPTDFFTPIIKRLEKSKKSLVNAGADYLLFTILDLVIDNYIYLLSVLGDKIEDLEDILLANPKSSTLDLINFYKRELNTIRRNIKPAVEIILTLTKKDLEYVSEENELHFKELLNNIKQVNEISDSYREILSDLLNIYHTTVSSKLNNVMMTLTMFSVIFIPLTFIAGIYGTNFDNIPELHYEYSYHFMWVTMLVITIFMMNYFRRKKWL
ncbi:magnesium/cobalt transporter CorA [Flammeovirga kamogawensis]|uniref:Magnesium transport protein CorA n=1 Tax=Flammeovirga kamogawensis TaxID=373891 RepID=A0ABX8H0I4_9BACT|nr:magnesium/cobalt transporter CorA [Flammeovirga kamogawensis]MBB6462199.1 magnesium transporter [Flammeovirga kamogawensis]QWG09400.1 magnesium/cobalt transporter CorA [Flammeovirga kamogawensis]TRX64918.1 magnesium/cobalt transporter CorA [Flammeovirga kamogawensis]